MSEALQIYEAQRAIAIPNGRHYSVQCFDNNSVDLKRDVDFGVIKGTKKPSLYKSGAEKIAMGYGMFQRYEIESKIENPDAKAPLFYYLVKCSLVKLVNGQEYIFTTGYGSANTSEKRNGFNSAYDAANGTLKMAQKRALVAAVISVSGLSDAFTQDMENEDYMAQGKDLLKTDDPESPVTTAQIRRLYAIGGESGLTTQEVKGRLAVMGYTSTKDIKQKDYNAVCDALEGKDGSSN